MAFQFNCDDCGSELNAPGAILFSPAEGDDESKRQKYHICVRCAPWYREKIAACNVEPDRACGPIERFSAIFIDVPGEPTVGTSGIPARVYGIGNDCWEFYAVRVKKQTNTEGGDEE